MKLHCSGTTHFVETYLPPSTAACSTWSEHHAHCVPRLLIPAGTKASTIHSYNIPRPNEPYFICEASKFLFYRSNVGRSNSNFRKFRSLHIFAIISFACDFFLISLRFIYYCGFLFETWRIRKGMCMLKLYKTEMSC